MDKQTRSFVRIVTLVVDKDNKIVDESLDLCFFDATETFSDMIQKYPDHRISQYQLLKDYNL